MTQPPTLLRLRQQLKLMEAKMERAKKAGMIGMGGAVLWVLMIVMEYAFDLQPPHSEGSLFIINQLLSFVALAGIAFGFLGIYWGRSVNGRFGKISVGMFVLGYVFIIIGGILVLFLGEDESPIFILFPIGGLLMDLGALFTGFGVVHAKMWQGWQRWMPLLYAAYLWLAIEIPFIIGVFPDGPGPVLEIIQGIGLFLVALAVYSVHESRTAVSRSVPSRSFTSRTTIR